MRVTSRPLKQFIVAVMLVAASVVNADNRDPNRDALYGLVDRMVGCWDRADAQGLSMLWQADGDIIVPDGGATFLRPIPNFECLWQWGGIGGSGNAWR